MRKQSSMAGLAAVLLGLSLGLSLTTSAGAGTTDPNRVEPYAGLSAEESRLLRLPVRRDYLRNVMDTCGAMYPARAASYRRAVTEWEEPHQAALDQAAQVASQRSYRVHELEMAPLITQEGRVLFSWQAGTLGIPAARQPDARDCDRFAEGIAALD